MIETEYQKEITSYLDQLTLSKSPKNLYDPIDYIMSLGGKRLRPYLLLLSAKSFGADIKEVLPQAAAIELFHNFTLIHDDIMDHAPLRRGQETVHHKWNENIGILSGDAMFVKAYEQLVKLKDVRYLPKVVEIFNTTALKVCEGQQYDMDFETLEDVSIQDYLLMIRLKTAELLGGAMQLGALVGGADEKHQQLFYDFAIYIGIAFQLMDDLLDVYADQAKFGKQVGGDIIENKKTYLYLKLAEVISEEDVKEWDQLKVDSNNERKVKGVKALYNKYNIDKACKELIEQYYLKGLDCAQQWKIPSKEKELILNFAGQLKQRDS